MKVDYILEDEEIIKYLQKRNLLRQYDKAKKFILSWHLELADFKLREPKSDWVYYFRINRQFRAAWRFRGNKFIVVEINNHQN